MSHGGANIKGEKVFCVFAFSIFCELPSFVFFSSSREMISISRNYFSKSKRWENNWQVFLLQTSERFFYNFRSLKLETKS